MIKKLKAKLRGAIKHVYLRYVWPSEIPWTPEEQMRAISLDQVEILKGSMTIGVKLPNCGPMGEWLAMLVGTLATIHDGEAPPNYRECKIRLGPLKAQWGKENDVRAVLTVQKVFGKTPHEMREEAETERDSWKEKFLATATANGEIGTALVNALCANGELRSIIFHFSTRVNKTVADAMLELNEPQRELLASIWRDSQPSKAEQPAAICRHGVSLENHCPSCEVGVNLNSRFRP